MDRIQQQRQMRKLTTVIDKFAEANHIDHATRIVLGDFNVIGDSSVCNHLRAEGYYNAVDISPPRNIEHSTETSVLKINLDKSSSDDSEDCINYIPVDASVEISSHPSISPEILDIDPLINASNQPLLNSNSRIFTNLHDYDINNDTINDDNDYIDELGANVCFDVQGEEINTENGDILLEDQFNLKNQVININDPNQKIDSVGTGNNNDVLQATGHSLSVNSMEEAPVMSQYFSSSSCYTVKFVSHRTHRVEDLGVDHIFIKPELEYLIQKPVDTSESLQNIQQIDNMSNQDIIESKRDIEVLNEQSKDTGSTSTMVVERSQVTEKTVHPVTNPELMSSSKSLSQQVNCIGGVFVEGTEVIPHKIPCNGWYADFNISDHRPVGACLVFGRQKSLVNKDNLNNNDSVKNDTTSIIDFKPIVNTRVNDAIVSANSLSER